MNYACEKCGKVFDGFEMDFRAAQIDKKVLCRKCREEIDLKKRKIPGVRAYSEKEKLALYYVGMILDSVRLNPFDAVNGIWLLEVHANLKKTLIPKVDAVACREAKKNIEEALSRKAGTVLPGVLALEVG